MTKDRLKSRARFAVTWMLVCNAIDAVWDLQFVNFAGVLILAAFWFELQIGYES